MDLEGCKKYILFLDGIQLMEIQWLFLLFSIDKTEIEKEKLKLIFDKLTLHDECEKIWVKVKYN